jgi:hypothetical protein
VGRALLAGAAVGTVLLAGHPAHAFRTAADQPQFAGTAKVRWAEDTISYELNDALPAGLTPDEVDMVAARALKSGTKPDCSRVAFGLAQHSAAVAAPGDGVNSIQFVRFGWSARGWDPTAAGMTDVQYEKNEQGQWVIVEADIYLNGEDHSWIASGTPSDQSRDLESGLTHEGGHMIGLLHPCEPGGAGGGAAQGVVADERKSPAGFEFVLTAAAKGRNRTILLASASRRGRADGGSAATVDCGVSASRTSWAKWLPKVVAVGPDSSDFARPRDRARGAAHD